MTSGITQRTWLQVDDCPCLPISYALFMSLGLWPDDKLRNDLALCVRSSTPKAGERNRARLAQSVGKENADELIRRFHSTHRWACVNLPGSLRTFTDAQLSEVGTESAFHFGDHCYVRVAEFAAFALRQGWAIPDEMASRAETHEEPEPTGWPWGGHETELLRHLAAAANRYWRNFDPVDPTTAPTSDVVEKFLVDRGVGARVAAVMAQILRADGLKPGPRLGRRQVQGGEE